MTCLRCGHDRAEHVADVGDSGCWHPEGAPKRADGYGSVPVFVTACCECSEFFAPPRLRIVGERIR